MWANTCNIRKKNLRGWFTSTFSDHQNETNISLSYYPLWSSALCDILRLLSLIFRVTKRTHSCVRVRTQLGKIYCSILLVTVLHVFLYVSNTFITTPDWNCQKIKQKLSNTLRLNFFYLKIIHILHPKLKRPILKTSKSTSIFMRLCQ